jgi:hypothetical protein
LISLFWPKGVCVGVKSNRILGATMKQKLQEFALVAEVISAIAIVASLVFVGIQIQQSSKINEVNAYQDLVNQISVLNILRIEDREFAELFGRYVSGEEISNRIDKAQMTAFLATTFRHADLAYRQYKSGIIDKQTLDSVLSLTNFWKQQNLGEIIWSDVARVLDPGFVSYMNDYD